MTTESRIFFTEFATFHKNTISHFFETDILYFFSGKAIFCRISLRKIVTKYMKKKHHEIPFFMHYLTARYSTGKKKFFFKKIKEKRVLFNSKVTVLPLNIQCSRT